MINALEKDRGKGDGEPGEERSLYGGVRELYLADKVKSEQKPERPEQQSRDYLEKDCSVQREA